MPKMRGQMRKRDAVAWLAHINRMDLTEMQELIKVAPADHPIFDFRYPHLYINFKRRYLTLGGDREALPKMVDINE